MEEKCWYRKGLRFSCQQCGRCCRDDGAYTEVYITREDIQVMAAHQDLFPHQFRRRHVTSSDKFLVLRSKAGTCCMLKAGQCRIYPVRPKQCRTWPFWPENLSRRAWYGVVRKRCPGVGQGQRYTVEDITTIIRTAGSVP